MASAALVVGTADAKQAHGSPTDPTRDTATQIQVPCQPQCPLGAPYLVRTCDVTAHQSPAGRGGACSRARARARWRARSVQCRLELAVPRRGAPAQMVLVVFTTPQEPRRGLPIPTSALRAVFRYDHQQSHSGGCAARSRWRATLVRLHRPTPFVHVAISLGNVVVLCSVFLSQSH